MSYDWSDRSFKALRPLMLAMLGMGSSMASHAGLFGDDEARTAILQLREQRAKDQEADTAKLSALATQIEQIKRSLLDMNAQLEQLRDDLARQRGLDEVMARDLSEIQRHQKDLQQGIDARVSKLEPQTVSIDGKSIQADPDEKREFDESLAKMRETDFAGGLSGLSAFLRKYPGTGYRESTLYWLGNAHYGLREYKEAIAVFRQLLNEAPKHMRAPEALLSIANCHAEIKEAKAARKALEELVKNYPESEAAQVARERIASTSAKTRG